MRPLNIHPDSQVIFERVVVRPDVADWLGRLGEYHPDTHQHSLRVGQMSTDIGRLRDHDESSQVCMCIAGLLHDVGKLQVPIEILDKPGKLDDEELGMLQEHCRAGFELLAKFEPMEVRDVVVAHHEFKVSPYPRSGLDRRGHAREEVGRRGAEPKIRLMAQIVSACDMFDALASPRSYKAPMGRAELESIIESQFSGDSALAKSVIDQYAYDD
jgi:HD-GYP domain-containing protein (c-di-GMP phosphodiesterase class II)